MNHFLRMHGLIGSMNKRLELELLRKIANMELYVEVGSRARFAKGLVYDKFDGANEHSRAKMDMTKTTVKGALPVGATLVEVVSTAGFKVGQEVTIYDYATTERRVISAIDNVITDNWKQVVAGRLHSLGIKADGTLWAWGSNSSGQLGDGTNISPVTQPKQIGTDKDWKQVIAGGTHSLALKNNGTLWAWGYNASGQVGDGTSTSVNKPKMIGTDTDWKYLSAGSDHTMAVKNDGSLWAWGKNSYSQLGLGHTTQAVRPTRVGTDNDWKMVHAGGNHTVALKTDGTLWAWGHNDQGQVGDNTETLTITTPKKIGTAIDWVSIEAGDKQSFAIKTDGTLWSWGSNTSGQLGTGSSVVNALLPKKVGTATDWRTVKAQGYFVVALKTDNSLWAWGQNTNGQLGDGTTTNTFVPGKIGTGLWKDIIAGFSHTLALKADNTLWAWGANVQGQLGDGSTTLTGVPNHPKKVGAENNVYRLRFSSPIQGTFLDNAGVARTNAIVLDGELTFGTWNGNTYEITEVN